MTFTYHWLHIKSGQRGVNTTLPDRFITAAELLEFLNRCNEQGCGIWQYWY